MRFACLGWGVALALGVLPALAGCGARTGFDVDPPEDGFDAGMDATVDAGPDVGPDTGPDVGPDTGPECMPFRARARPAPLDIFVLMDSSGSMEDDTEAGVTKDEAVTDALRDFVGAEESEGLGIALTFFPIIDESVPEYCDRDADCGMADACLEPDICVPSGELLCRTDADCTDPGDTCEPLGRCVGAEAFCLPSMGIGCPAGERCEDFGLCENRISCDVGGYSRPTVDIGLLPDRGPAIVSAMESRPPEGGTPTLPALEGALRSAERRADANPGNKVIVLLATDGFPTDCDPTIDVFGEPDPSAGIPMVVDAAAAGADSGIQTFVVGVFAPDEEMEARANLSEIAMAGGTDDALVITTAEPVTERLIEILDELRTSIRTCTYSIPAEGRLPDPDELQVRIVPPEGAPMELERRETPEDCDPMTGGYFFEQELEPGERPGYVELCPASCELTASGPGYTVEMEAGCDEM